MAKKIIKAVLISLGSLIALILIALFAKHLITPLIYPDFFPNTEKEYEVPGLFEGVVPQGYTYVESEKAYLMCGYMTDNESPSRIYVTTEDGKSSKYVSLVTKDGKAYTGHTGGIASDGSRVWLANDGSQADNDNGVWVLSLKDILDAKDGGELVLDTFFVPECRSAFCLVDGEYLWVGEFRDSEKYLTKETHTFEVGDGETNYALICKYKLDPSTETGIDGNTPEAILSVRDLVQGFIRTDDGSFVLSCSYGLANSHMYKYDDVTKGAADTSLEVNGEKVPVWYLSDEDMQSDVEMPPMSEELVYKDGRVYVLFESACNKYIFGNFMRGRHIYSYKFD